VCTPTIEAIPCMLQLQDLNHLGSVTLMPCGGLRSMEPLVHHHRLLNYYQPRFGWKHMPYSTGLRASPIHYTNHAQQILSHAHTLCWRRTM
jgi:hypothetical protein